AETMLRLADLLVTSLTENTIGQTYADRALAMVERLSDPRLETAAYCAVGNVRMLNGEVHARVPLLERALALARAQDDPVRLAETAAYLANAYAFAGDLTRSWEMSVLREGEARRTRDPFHIRDVYVWMGTVRLMRGELAAAEDLVRRQEAALNLS